MNKKILILSVLGAALLALKMPQTLMGFGFIFLVEVVTINVVWRILQVFSRRPKAPDCHPCTHNRKSQ